MWQVLIELIRKIELQSILVLLITLTAGYLLLNKDNSLNTPSGVLGSLCIVIGLLYTYGSFYSNQIRESYKDVISEYKSTINTLRTSTKDMQEMYKGAQTSIPKAEKIGEYQVETPNAGTINS
jgi:hypothetical protein